MSDEILIGYTVSELDYSYRYTISSISIDDYFYCYSAEYFFSLLHLNELRRRKSMLSIPWDVEETTSIGEQANLIAKSMLISHSAFFQCLHRAVVMGKTVNRIYLTHETPDNETSKRTWATVQHHMYVCCSVVSIERPYRRQHNLQIRKLWNIWLECLT